MPNRPGHDDTRGTAEFLTWMSGTRAAVPSQASLQRDLVGGMGSLPPWRCTSSWSRTIDRFRASHAYQPSQVYFPESAASDAELQDADEDIASPRRMLRTVYDRVGDRSEEGGFQVIVTEHANLPGEWFQECVIEVWRGGTKLMPDLVALTPMTHRRIPQVTVR